MKLILISEQTHRPGIDNIGDINSWCESDVVLGPAYDGFDVIEIKELTVADFIEKMNAMAPETRTVSRINVPQNEWAFEPPEQKEVYKDGEQWKEISEMPKYAMILDKAEIGNLTGASDKEAKLTVLETAMIPNVKSNQTVIDIYEKGK